MLINLACASFWTAYVSFGKPGILHLKKKYIYFSNIFSNIKKSSKDHIY